MECVTGDNENPSVIAHRFSPISNNKPEIGQLNQDLRVLITTDVLSEGQNLQDCHVILNYDLPWAIIRLIQRAARGAAERQRTFNEDAIAHRVVVTAV